MNKKGVVVWLTGLPASGKTTLAVRVQESLQTASQCSVLLDGDEVRQALRPRPGYSAQSRNDFYCSLGNLAGLLSTQGLIVLVPATASLQEHRDWAKQQAPRFIEIYVDTPAEVCCQRDVKGLYAKAKAGELDSLPGIGATYQRPESPDIVAQGGHDEVALATLLSKLKNR